MKEYGKIILAAGIGSIVSLGFMEFQNNKRDQEIQKIEPQVVSKNHMPVQQVGYSPLSEGSFINASEKSTKSVVHIKTKQRGRTQYYQNDPFAEIFGYRRQRMPQQGQNKLRETSSGSGVIISKDGYIVTNNHVIDGADELEITLHDNRTFVAEVIGVDPTTDLALVKIPENGLDYLEFSNSDDVQVGEWVLAVGNPFKLNSTVTSGIVSAKARNINILKNQNAIESFIQTDAAVNPGNSGGALVNTKGELIGVNTAIASNTGSYTGYSFAIPANIVSKVVSDLLDFGLVQRAYIGVSIRDVDSKLKIEENLDLNEGVYIAGLVDNGAALEAGIEKGDIIIGVDGSTIKSTAQLMEKIGSKRPGDQVSVEINRNGEVSTKIMTLKNKNGEHKVIAKKDLALESLLGATLQEVEEGIEITELQNGLLSKNTNIREGFVILSVDHKPVSSVKALENYLKKKEGGVLIAGRYKNSQSIYYYGLGLE
ncbi:MAG: trypsin-like peptidase domain-containing protein [Flavobacteriales bacterium]